MRLFTTFLCAFCFFLTTTAQNLVSSEFIKTISTTDFLIDYGLIVPNAVDLYKVLYETPDLVGVTDTASGLVVIPRGQTVLPQLLYQRGTVDNRQDVPSNLAGGAELPIILGAYGYLTSAADLLGMGTARGTQLYVHAATEASAAIDLLYAAQEVAAEQGVSTNKELFITGYSQGGHSSMAAHRALELSGNTDFNIAATSHMSGPYSISGVMKDLMIGETEYFSVAYLPNTMISYQAAYGNLYDKLEDVLKPDYITPVQRYIDEEIGLFELNGLLIETLLEKNGKSVGRFMFQDSVVNNILTNPNHPFNIALQDNDVYDWAPQAPTLLLYCKADDQVPYLNSIVADSVMAMNGAADVTAIDVGSNLSHGQCVQPAANNTLIFFQNKKNSTLTSVSTLQETAFSIHPNPARETLRLQNNQSVNIQQVFISNLQGQIIASFSDNIREIPVNHLPHGMYQIQVVTESGFWTKRFIVID